MKLLKFAKKYWAEILVVFIFILAFYVRIVGFHYPYLRNIDSYAFYAQMKYIYEHGSLPAVNKLMLAPTGEPIGRGTVLYSYLGAYTYKLFKIFMPDLKLWRFLIYFPAFLASLSAIPLYIAGKNIYDKKAGLFFSFLMIFNPAMMSRTLGGDPDSDCIVFLMTTIVFMAVSFMIKYKYDKKKMIYSSIFAGISLTLFALSWVGYWYLYWIIIGYFILVAIFDGIYNYSKTKEIDKSHLKKMGTSFLIMTTVMILTAVPYFGFRFINSTFKAPFETLSMFSPTGGIKGEGGQFPNVYVSVAEMMSPGGAIKIIMSDPSKFILTFVTIIYLLYAYFKEKKHLDTAAILISWLFVTFYASITAVRFMIFLAMPLALGTSIFLSKVFRLLTGEDKNVIE